MWGDFVWLLERSRLISVFLFFWAEVIVLREVVAGTVWAFSWASVIIQNAMPIKRGNRKAASLGFAATRSLEKIMNTP